jgi:murein L,D-transpeptidase YcbB/YkuD
VTISKQKNGLPWLRMCVAAAIACVGLPGTAAAQADPAVAAAIAKGDADRETKAFYRARGWRPLWIRGNAVGPEAERALELLVTAQLDGLDPEDYRPRAVAEALDRGLESGNPRALARAELMLSRAFATYMRDMRARRPAGMVYVDRVLAPDPLSMREALDATARATSLQAWVDNLGWMHPIYGQLRAGLAAQEAETPFQRVSATPGWAGPEGGRLIRLNMERARALPADPAERYILVDAAAARLYMYQNGRVVDSMKVIVGKPSEQTPIMAGLIRYSMTNPYWNLPPDLARRRVADGVLKEGPKFLKAKRYEVLSDWTEDAKPIDPKTVDWRAVANGSIELPVRQLPGKDNAMGRVKFMFPNELGIYLHDTPEKNLFAKADRRFSSGCVRVEDASRLAKWLYGKPLTIKPGGSEQRVDLPQPVPVYITYLTAAPEGKTIAFRSDVYGRDSVGRDGRALARR